MLDLTGPIQGNNSGMNVPAKQPALFGIVSLAKGGLRLRLTTPHTTCCLPIVPDEQPNRFFFTLNLKAAKAIGLNLP